MVAEGQRTVLVTGASSGIGRSVSQALLDKGYAVIGISRSISPKQFPNEAFTALPCDLSDELAIEQVIVPLLKKQPLFAAVFCAGTGYFGNLEQLERKKMRALLEINLISPMMLTKLIVPYFKQRKTGRLIYIGSEAALQGAKNGSVYCASKFGLRGFVQSLAAECRQAGVCVSLVNPGMVDSPFFDALSFQPGDDPSNAIQVETVAQYVAMIMQTDANTVVEEINLSPRNKVIQNK